MIFATANHLSLLILQAEVFGSFKTGLYLPTSDIDVILLFPHTFVFLLHHSASCLINGKENDSREKVKELRRILLYV